MDKAIVSITNNSSWQKQDFIHIGDDRYAVIYRVSVRTEIGEEQHLVVSAQSHSIDQAGRETLRGNLRKTNARAIISFFIANREGWAQVITMPGEEFNHFNLAAAIAVIKAWGSWDESPSIVVMINDTEIQVWPRFDGQNWVVGERGDEL
jgi:hypothetical protein